MNQPPTQAELDAAEDAALENAIYNQWLGKAVESSNGPSLTQQYRQHLKRLEEKKK